MIQKELRLIKKKITHYDFIVIYQVKIYFTYSNLLRLLIFFNSFQRVTIGVLGFWEQYVTERVY